MTLDELKRLIETADWFANLGKAKAAPGIIPVTESEWQQLVRAAVDAEFGLPKDASLLGEPPFPDMIWLPTANDEPDLIHGRALEDAARHLNREGELKAACIEVFRLALTSQRGVPERPVLKVGATDSNNAARGAGRFACRMAASEIVVDRVGFWCGIVPLFHKGHFPLGRLPGGEIAVL